MRIPLVIEVKRLSGKNLSQDDVAMALAEEIESSVDCFGATDDDDAEAEYEVVQVVEAV